MGGGLDNPVMLIDDDDDDDDVVSLCFVSCLPFSFSNMKQS